MALFRCTYSQGSGGYTLTVTTDSSLSGATVTATDGTTTLTSTFTSSSPYTAEFSIPNGGTWTITSGTASQNVTVPSSVEIHNTPTGSSATPTDNIQTWLHCASIWDKNYTTIAAVLADTTTLLALISDNNAVDYMVRSTSWASNVTANSTAMTYIGNNNYCANKLLSNSTWCAAICNSTYYENVLKVKVPTMTGYSSPSGQVRASYSYSNNYAWQAFNGIEYPDWDTYGQASAGQWIEYVFPSAVAIHRVMVHAHASYLGLMPKTVKIQASSDGNTYTDMLTNQSRSKITGDQVLAPITSMSKYRYWRLYVSEGWSNEVLIGYMNFYGRS